MSVVVRLAVCFAVPVAMLVLTCASAQAKVEKIGGKSYGVVPRNSSASTPGGANAKGETQPPLTYGGGPLILTAKFYAIFWGPAGSFAPSYDNSIIQYLKDEQADSGKLTNDYSVSTQYVDGSSRHITSNVAFVTSLNDTTPYPTPKLGQCASDPNPCFTDAQLQTEIKSQIAAHGWETDPASAPVAEYLVFTPKGTDSCFGSSGGCSTGAYCGYHAEITGADGGTNVAIYSNGPYVAGCDSGNAPAGVSGNVDADGTLDTLAHELGESATDPAPPTGYTDSGGQEIGDKCQNGAINNDLPLGGSATASTPTLYNQVINGHQYYTQTLWSNAPTQTPSSAAAAGCLQRLGPTPMFLPPTGVAAGRAEVFDASGSYDAGSTISSYVWNFGDGSPNVSGKTVSHTFATGGTYVVKLTVSDAAGNATTETMSVAVPKLEISQLRPGVSASSQDSFVEIYNPSSSPVSLTGWHLITVDHTLDDVSQNLDFGFDTAGTTVAPDSYILAGGGGYSLSAYAPLDDNNLTLVPNSTVLLEDPSGNVNDAVCLCATSVSATGIGRFSGAGQYAFVRQLHTGGGGVIGKTGTPQFTGSNPADFALVRPEADNLAGTVLTSYEGSPGPHDFNSPVIVNPNIGVSLLTGTNASAQPNQQLVPSGPTANAIDTLYLRRKITNNTGSPIDSLRFRVSDITTGSTPAPPSTQAILGVVSDPGGSIIYNSIGYELTQMTLDNQSNGNTDGGGLNASLVVPSITTNTPLANGSSITVEFKLGVQRGGRFAFFFDTEATTG